MITEVQKKDAVKEGVEAGRKEAAKTGTNLTKDQTDLLTRTVQKAVDEAVTKQPGKAP